MYIRALSLPLLVRKASRSWRLLIPCHPSTVLLLVSFPMTSPHSSLYAGWGFVLDVLQRPLVYVSPGVFFSPDIRDFLSSCHGTYVWRFETCALFSSRLLGVFLGLCLLGHSCQRERLHRRSLAVAIVVASVSDGFISGACHLQQCSHLTFVLLVHSYVRFLPWHLLSQCG